MANARAGNVQNISTTETIGASKHAEDSFARTEVCLGVDPHRNVFIEIRFRSLRRNRVVDQEVISQCSAKLSSTPSGQLL